MNAKNKYPLRKQEAHSVKQEAQFNRTFINSNTKRIEFHEILPHNDEAERNLLNQCLSDPEATDRVRKLISAEDLYRAGAKKVFERLCEFRDAGREYTPSLILDSFEVDLDFERIENLFYEIAPFYTGGFARGYANIVLESSVKRSIIRIFEESIEYSLSVRPDVDLIISNLEEATREIKSRWLKKQEVADGK